jgi:hypothetical protein
MIRPSPQPSRFFTEKAEKEIPDQEDLRRTIPLAR